MYLHVFFLKLTMARHMPQSFPGELASVLVDGGKRVLGTNRQTDVGATRTGLNKGTEGATGNHGGFQNPTRGDRATQDRKTAWASTGVVTECSSRC